MEERLIKLFDDIIVAVKAGATQLPYMVEQALTFWFWEAVLMALLQLAIILVLHRVARWGVNAQKTWEEFDSAAPPPIFVSIGAWVAMLVLTLKTFDEIVIALKVWLTPQLFVLEKLKELL